MHSKAIKPSLTLTGLIAALVMLFGIAFAPSASATESGLSENPTINTSTNSGVSTISPSSQEGSYSIRSTVRPSNVWEVSKSGKYSFSGHSHYQTLYTNWQFKGRNSYTIHVNNTGSGTITVKAKSFWSTYAQTRVAQGRSATIQLSGIGSGTTFYLTFDGNEYSFNGYIS